jgi:hypothetical protein
MDYSAGGGRMKKGDSIELAHRVTPSSSSRKRHRLVNKDYTVDPCALLSTSQPPPALPQVHQTTDSEPGFPQDIVEDVDANHVDSFKEDVGDLNMRNHLLLTRIGITWITDM